MVPEIQGGLQAGVLAAGERDELRSEGHEGALEGEGEEAPRARPSVGFFSVTPRLVVRRRRRQKKDRHLESLVITRSCSTRTSSSRRARTPSLASRNRHARRLRSPPRPGQARTRAPSRGAPRRARDARPRLGVPPPRRTTARPCPGALGVASIALGGVLRDLAGVSPAEAKKIVSGYVVPRAGRRRACPVTTRASDHPPHPPRERARFGSSDDGNIARGRVTPGGEKSRAKCPRFSRHFPQHWPRGAPVAPRGGGGGATASRRTPLPPSPERDR